MSSAASRMSAATANSAPPPSAWPFSTAMVGVGKPAIRSQMVRIRKAMPDASSSVRNALSSLRSPPDTNARSPAPVMTSALAPSVPSRAFSSWSIVSSEMALRACGRSMVMTASPSSNSRSTIKRSPSAALAFSLSENSIAAWIGGAARLMRTIPVELTKRYVEEGWWTQDTLGDLIARGLHASPDAGFHVHSAVRPFAGTFHDVEIEARRLAAGLRARGVGPGDVVALQLPNWKEAAATFWASTFLGAVTVPIVHFYGRKELTHILGTAKPRVFITAEEFGRMQFQPDLCAAIPIVGLVGKNYHELLAAEPMTGTVATDPGNPALIAFTSGTTTDPKGVVHSHQTLGFETRQLLENYPAERGRQLTATPVGHFIGMLAAFLIPVLEGAPIDLCDVWGPGNVLKLIRRDGLSIGGGPPYFVTS